MDNGDQAKINKNRLLLKQRLPPELNSIVDLLMEAEIFSQQNHDDIMHVSPNTDENKVSKFISLLLGRGQRAFDSFVQVLKRLGGYDDLLAVLVVEENKALNISQKKLCQPQERQRVQKQRSDLQQPRSTTRKKSAKSIREKKVACHHEAFEDVLHEHFRAFGGILTAKLQEQSEALSKKIDNQATQMQKLQSKIESMETSGSDRETQYKILIAEKDEIIQANNMEISKLKQQLESKEEDPVKEYLQDELANIQLIRLDLTGRVELLERENTRLRVEKKELEDKMAPSYLTNKAYMFRVDYRQRNANVNSSEVK